MSCVNTSSKEFKEMSKELNVKPSYLEMVIHKFQNTVGNEDNFPTKEYVMNTLKGKPFESSNEQLDIYINNKYNIPLTFATEKLASNKVNELRSIYPDNSVTMYQNNDGEYIVTVGTPMFEGVPFALDNTLIDNLLEKTKNSASSYAQLFNALVSTIGKDKISVEQLANNFEVNPEGHPAFFQPGKEKIYFYPTILQSYYKNVNATESFAKNNIFLTTLHELSHQAGYWAIASPKTEAQRAFSAKIKSLYEEAKELLGDDKSIYGLKNEQEFFAEALSKKSFQIKLAQARKNGNKTNESVWSKFVNAFKTFFKDSLDIDINGSILADILVATDNFLKSEKEYREYSEEADKAFAQSLSELDKNLPYESYTLDNIINSKNNKVSQYNYYFFKTSNDVYAVNIPDRRVPLAKCKEKIEKLLIDNGYNPIAYNIGNFKTLKDGRTVIYVNRLPADTIAKKIEAIREEFAERQTIEDSIRNKRNTYTDAEEAFLTLLKQNGREDLVNKVENGLIDLSDLMINEDELTLYAEPTNIGPETKINIYTGTNENADLSNFAERLVAVNNVVPQNTPWDANLGQFRTVEGAFQAQKLHFSTISEKEKDAIGDKLREASGIEARKIGKTISGLDVAKWDANSSKIMKAIIKASFEQNPQALQRLLDTGNATLTHTQDKSKWGTEFPKLLMEVRDELRTSTKEKTMEDLWNEVNNEDLEGKNNIPKQEKVTNDQELTESEEAKTSVTEDPFIARQLEIQKQIDNLLNDNIISATEVRHIAEQVVYYISDHITEMQKDPESAVKKYGDRLKGKNLSEMSRADIVRAIGPDNIIAYCKEVFSPEHHEEWDDDVLIDKAILITDNWDAIMQLASDVFLNNEKFTIISSSDGKIREVNEELNADADDFNASNMKSEVEETEGSLQEHWQVESKTIDVLDSMSQLVRQALQQCYLLDKDGNEIVSEWGIKERVNAREVTNSILRWTQGALTLADMVEKLKRVQESNPWVSQLIDRLSDDSGKESDFQSQFFSVFCKPFQSYSVVTVEDGKYKSINVNESPALREAVSQVTTQYKIGEHPLFTTEGINKESLAELDKAFESLNKFKHTGNEVSKEVFKKEASETLSYISNLLGYYVIPDMVTSNLTEDNFRKMYSALYYIVKALKSNVDNKTYEPFKFRSKDSITGNLREFLKPITEHLEDTAVSAFYDSGKMYQSYITPSYMTLLMQKFNYLEGEEFDKFIENEYGQYSWFHTGNNIETGWRWSWLKEIVTDSKAKELFKHKVQLNFNKKNYMRNMSDVEYVLSVLTEYWSESISDKQDRVPAWFRVAMLSNKPSSEFIRFYSERGINYKETIVNNMHGIFDTELCRIQTVRHRNLTKENSRYIGNFDKNGKRFMFLSFLNDYLDGKQKSSELGKLLNDKLDGKKVDEVKLYDLVNKAIFDAMNEKATSIVNDWISQGILEGAKKIKGIGNTEEEIRANLENFVWNDAYASMNIMALTISDIAFYKNADDLQKRMAQIHSPGIRGNAEARDYKGNKVTDGKVRHIVITDFDNFISNVIDNVSVVFDRRIASATGGEKEGLKALKESLVGKDGAYRYINVADAQAYNSPTSYRKKAFMFGRWSENAEKTYERVRRGEKPTYSDLMIAFQPLKPFLYGSHSVNTGVNDANLLQNLKVNVQCKNSEYLLILADAITQGEETGKPNLLRALYEVMEESHFDTDGNYKLDGIDTVQFESAIKTGKGATIDISKYANMDNGEAIAKSVLKSCIYQTETREYESKDKDGNPVMKEANVQVGGYNLDFVNEMPAEAYSLQQEVPEHFKDHAQVHGSQLRYIIPSELAEVDTFGNPVTFDVEGRELSAKEFKKEYENTIADNIEESINDLAKLLHIDKFNYKERNIALSKILQREILSSPRYGVDLLQACSIDENGKFRIPLGDPIQSKRIEQLLNSIIKNRVNKQEIAGGPVVQVSNFGTSRQLNIKFKDKNGGFLKTRNEFEGTDAEFLKYIEENQGGIAYFEVYAPIYSNELFKKFVDKDGNIDIQTIEQIDPELLKMVGYRIPTEAKYSAAPLKIVGFLPREAGDGIMFPYEITLLNGSDFDVDKAYLMRKEIDIATRFIQKENESMSDAEKDYVKHNKKSIADYLVKAVNLRGKTTAEERTEIVKKATSNAEYEKRLAKRIHEENLRKIEERSKTAEDVIDNKELSDKEYNKQSDKEEKFYEKSVKKENERYEAELAKIDARKDEAISNNISKLEEKKVRERIKQFLIADKFTSSRSDDALTRELRKAYIAYMYHSVTPTSGKIYRNNKIVDMTYEVLTHETSCAEMLNPGGFEPEKKMGYLVTAYKSEDNTKSWEELSAMKVEDLKKLSSADKNLCFIDTQIQYYKQNAAGSSLIGIFAVHRTAHAIIENEGYQIDIDNACKIDQPFVVAGMSFGGNMPIDVRYDRMGVSVGKAIGRGVACSADTAKEPVFDHINVNISTANVLIALERLGMPFEDAALFLSQSAITRMLNKYSTENVTSYTTLSKVIDARIKELEASLEITEASPLQTEELTKEELIAGLKDTKNDEVEYKTLKAFRKFQKIANAMRMPTMATRFNSISSAVGPLIIDNLITEYQMQKLSSEGNILGPDGEAISMEEIFAAHPILNQFRKTLGIAKTLFGNMPANSTGFRNIVDSLADTPVGDIIMSDRKLLSKLSDFYQSYLVVAGGVVDASRLESVIGEFPKNFIKEQYKQKYADNLLIQSIKYGTDKGGRATLQVDITGLDTDQKERLGNAWTDLHKVNPELSLKLFEYCFFRGGIGFNPKTFMSLIPVTVKEKIPKYVDTFRVLPDSIPKIVIDQFIRNNWDNNKLVPRERNLYAKNITDGVIEVYKENDIERLKDTQFFKMKVGNEDRLYEQLLVLDNSIQYKRIKPLGSNKDYLEISMNDISKPIEDTTEVIDIEDETGIIRTNPEEDTSREDNALTDAQVTDLLYQAYMASGISKEAVDDIVEKYRKKSERDKANFEKGVKNFLRNRFDLLNIKYDESLIDKVYDKLC